MSSDSDRLTAYLRELSEDREKRGCPKTKYQKIILELLLEQERIRNSLEDSKA